MPELIVMVDVDAPPERVWRALTTWEHQGEWMPLTRVRGTGQGGQGVGAGIEGFTGIGRVGFLDTMEVTGWEPPRRCVVRHTGRVVRGSGAFEVQELGPGRSRFVWGEIVDLPLGRLGLLGWPLVRPFVRGWYAVSMRRFKRYVEALPAA